MKAHATHYSAKCTPRKARLLRGIILGKTAHQALALLAAERRAGSVPTLKLIRSAIAQLPANHQPHAIVSTFTVNEGPKRKSYMPRAQGRASLVLKRTAHLHIELNS